jgi:hypothetical protein
VDRYVHSRIRPHRVVLNQFSTRKILTLKNGVFWDVILRDSCKYRRCGETYRLDHQDDKLEALTTSETSVLTRTTQRNIPEDAILHSHRRENLKSYNFTFALVHARMSVGTGSSREISGHTEATSALTHDA